MRLARPGAAAAWQARESAREKAVEFHLQHQHTGRQQISSHCAHNVIPPLALHHSHDMCKTASKARGRTLLFVDATSQRRRRGRRPERRRAIAATAAGSTIMPIDEDDGHPRPAGDRCDQRTAGRACVPRAAARDELMNKPGRLCTLACPLRLAAVLYSRSCTVSSPPLHHHSQWQCGPLRCERGGYLLQAGEALLLHGCVHVKPSGGGGGGRCAAGRGPPRRLLAAGRRRPCRLLLGRRRRCAQGLARAADGRNLPAADTRGGRNEGMSKERL